MGKTKVQRTDRKTAALERIARRLADIKRSLYHLDGRRGAYVGIADILHSLARSVESLAGAVRRDERRRSNIQVQTFKVR